MTAPLEIAPEVPVIEGRDVWKRYGALTVLRGVSFSVARGEVLAVLGPSGSGKSTLLRCVNHLEPVDRGTIRVNGQRIGYEQRRGRLYEARPHVLARQRSSIGMVFQTFNLFSHMTVRENLVEAPRRVLHLGREESDERALTMLERVGLAAKVDAYPRELSGGQQQRAAIARALVMRPEVMLFDEPTSALDPELVGEVLQVIAELAHSGMTLVIVTHEIRFAREAADTAMFMDGGEVLERGTAASVLDRPTHPRTQQFLERVLG